MNKLKAVFIFNMYCTVIKFTIGNIYDIISLHGSDDILLKYLY